MFWNADFIPATTHIDTLLTQPGIKLSEILFEDEVLQELKTYNGNLLIYLCKPEIIAELVDNIAQLTRENCSEKLLYSRVHEAYLSCEILTAGQIEIFTALTGAENLKKILICLTHDKEDEQRMIPQKATLVSKLISCIHSGAPDTLSCYITQDMESFSKLIDELVENIDVSGSFEILSTFISRTDPPESRYIFCELLSKLKFVSKLIDIMTLSGVEDKQRNACQLLCDIIVIGRQEASEQATNASKPVITETSIVASAQPARTSTAVTTGTTETLTTAEAAVSTETTTTTQSQPTETTTPMTETTPTSPSTQTTSNNDNNNTIEQTNNTTNNNNTDTESSVEAPSNSEEQPAKPDSSTTNDSTIDSVDFSHANVNHTDQTTSRGQSYQDMLSELLESSEAVHLILSHMFPNKTANSNNEEINDRSINTTAIVCGMKVLQTLVEQKKINDVHYQNLVKTIDRIQDEIVAYLSKFHELLLDPPRQEPIKTTFGVIQKPLGYIRFEVVNSIRALISTNSPKIVNKLVELKTIQVIIDLFIEYSWNNLLHTQVEQALCLIIKNCRSDEEMNYPNEKPAAEIPSKALLSQALNECDLIGRLLLQTRNGEQANFGHIIQIINSIAINSDLDVIQDHLSEMKEKRSELHHKWTTFVNVDVASFKEIELYYDNHVENRFEQLRHNHITNNNHFINNPSIRDNRFNRDSLSSLHFNSTNNVDLDAKMKKLEENANDELKALIAYAKETVIPTINVDVLPKVRSSSKQMMNMSSKID